MRDFLHYSALSGKRTPVARLGGGLMISTLLHLSIIISVGPITPRPSAAWERTRHELTVTLVPEVPGTTLAKPVLLAREPVTSNPISVPLPPVPRYFESREVDVPAQIINDVLLQYPPDAYEQTISGEVKLRLFINQDGGVDEVAIIAAEPKEIFDAAAVAAAKQLRYSPALKDGVPVRTTKTIAITFDPTTRPL